MIRLENITLGQYASRNSIIHRLDPRTKLIMSFLLMFLVLYIQQITILLSLLIGVLVLYILAKLKLTLAFNNLRMFLFLFLITFILHVFFTSGKVLYHVPYINIHITYEGITNGIFYTLRIALLIIMANLLSLTTSPMAITDAIERLLSPLKKIGVPAHEIAMMMSISIRFIPILLEEADRIRRAQVSRGAHFDGHIAQRLKSVIPIIIPLFLSTFRRANDLAFAMDARCYRGGYHRTSYYRLQFKRADAVAVLLICLISIPVFLLR